MLRKYFPNMKGFAVLGVCLMLSAARAQVTLLGSAGAASETVTEGIESVFTIECSVVAPPATDMIVTFSLETATTAENNYDFPDIAGYTCTISALMTTGAVTIPFFNDVVIETANELIVLAASATPANTYTVTIIDNDAGGAKVIATPRRTLYTVGEGSGTLDIWFDFLDANGDPAPIEDDLTFAVTTPTIDSATVTTDYTFTAAYTWTASAAGSATISALVQIGIVQETTILENLENVHFQFADNPVVDSITIASTVEVQIQDDDKPEFLVINDMTPLPRRSKEDVFLWAFVNYPATITTPISYTWIPHNLKDKQESTITVNGNDVFQVRLPRPKRNSKSRFNEYKCSTTQMFNADVLQTYAQVAYTYLTPTSHVKKSAPIETGSSPTITVFPNAPTCTALDDTYTISIPLDVTNSELRWDFIPEGGTKFSRKRMRQYNGRNQVSLTACDDAGLYIAYRKDRKKIGWEEYIRVILASCPKETGGTNCATANLVCNNGGLVLPELELCSCPPGFAGPVCEIALDPGLFGSNGEFDIRDFPVESRLGKCVMFSFDGPLGVTCAAGWTGTNCCQACKIGGSFGANCDQTCHCADDLCDRFSGACANGCVPGFSGPNCQQ